MEDNQKIYPLEHVEQLMSVDPSLRDNQKEGNQRRKSKRHAEDIEGVLKEEQQQRQARDDGHVDYHA